MIILTMGKTEPCYIGRELSSGKRQFKDLDESNKWHEESPRRNIGIKSIADVEGFIRNRSFLIVIGDNKK